MSQAEDRWIGVAHGKTPRGGRGMGSIIETYGYHHTKAKFGSIQYECMTMVNCNFILFCIMVNSRFPCSLKLTLREILFKKKSWHSDITYKLFLLKFYSFFKNNFNLKTLTKITIDVKSSQIYNARYTVTIIVVVTVCWKLFYMLFIVWQGVKVCASMIYPTT